MLMFSTGFTADLLAPSPGRFSRAFEISLVATLVVIVLMTFQIPEPAISTYIVFFAAKENSGLSMLMSLVLILVITVVLAISFALSIQLLDWPEIRILALAVVAFIFFFLATASKLAPLAGTMGLIVAYVLDLLGSSPIGEITTRGLLYAWLFVATPMGIFFAYNLFFGRHPEALLRRELAVRIRTVAAMLGARDESSKRRLASSVREGNAELLQSFKMIKLLGRQPRETQERLAVLMTLSYSLMTTVDAFEMDAEGRITRPTEREHSAEGATDGGEVAQASQAARKAPASSDVKNDLLVRLDKLAIEIERLPRVIHSAPEAEATGQVVPPNDLTGQIISLVGLMEDAVAGRTLPELPKAQAAEKKKSGFFKPDAFTNPDHTRYAGKAAATVMICYLTFSLLDWPGIHTCMLTCFIVALSTVGETIQKLVFRITGCLMGAAAGLLTIVFILPHTTSITELALLIFVLTLPAAWVSVGRPTVAYVGFQIALALYLCILQGTEPKFDLTIARDRTIGILFGNIVVYLVFTRVFPISIMTRLRRDVVVLLGQCRAVLKSISSATSPIQISGQMSEIQIGLGEVENALASFDYETRRSRHGRLSRWAGYLSLRAVRRFVDELARLAAYPPVDGRQDEARDVLLRMGRDLDDQLGAVAQRISETSGHEAREKQRSGPELSILRARLRGTAPSVAARIERLESLQNRLHAVSLTLSRYGRLLHVGGGANG
jgi:multidrug resistance protein MdtO